MASTNKTAHLALNQWVLSDPLLMEDVNEDNRKIDAAVGALPYVKLFDITTTAEAQQVDLDISGIDFSKFAMVQLFSNALALPKNTATLILIRINNGGGDITESMYNYGQSITSKDYVAAVEAPRSGTCAIRVEMSGFMREKPNDPGPLLIRSMGASFGKNRSLASLYCYRYITNLSDLKTINCLTDNTAVNIKAGSRFVLYGVKL